MKIMTADEEKGFWPEKNGILYHYTDFSALEGILGQAQLRLNNVLNMNDAAEMNLFMYGICKKAAALFAEEERPDKAQLVQQIFAKEQKDRFSYSAYAACFSRYRDDAAQWERYGNQGRGICIAFDESLLSKMAKAPLSLKPVIYREDINESLLADRICDILRGDISFEDYSKEPALRSALNRAWAASAAYKHPSFASENEVRLLVSPFEQGYFDVKPEYHISRERIKKYYPLDLDKMCAEAETTFEELIVELIIGPESTQSLPILKDYLLSLGYCTLSQRISYSKCPLRKNSL